MKIAEPLTISTAKIRHIKQLAAAAGESREDERSLNLLKEAIHPIVDALNLGRSDGSYRFEDSLFRNASDPVYVSLPPFEWQGGMDRGLRWIAEKQGVRLGRPVEFDVPPASRGVRRPLNPFKYDPPMTVRCQPPATAATVAAQIAQILEELKYVREARPEFRLSRIDPLARYRTSRDNNW